MLEDPTKLAPQLVNAIGVVRRAPTRKCGSVRSSGRQSEATSLMNGGVMLNRECG